MIFEQLDTQLHWHPLKIEIQPKTIIFYHLELYILSCGLQTKLNNWISKNNSRVDKKNTLN